jgi:hypothetical protein
MVSEERLLNLETQCKKFIDTSYSFVECGVAKGGCLALMKHVSGPNNNIFGLDSFEGLPAITDKDRGTLNCANPDKFVNANLSGGIQSVYETFNILKMDMTRIHLIKGFFKDTLTNETIDSMGTIAVLRLDGDWYESTKICLETLYDKVIIGGVIIIDDYGYWVGAKNATDEFRTERSIESPLVKTDYTEYYWIKTA